MKKSLFEAKTPIKLTAHAGYRQAMGKLDELKKELTARRSSSSTG
jgi:hypothetical protein